MRRSSVRALAAVACALPFAAQARGPAVPRPDAQGVKAVFGHGEEPKVHADQGNPWKKHFDVPGKGPMTVMLSYGDESIAARDGRIFEAKSPFRLPDGRYTWIVLRDGTMVFGRPIDDWEIGTRHAHLAHGRPVVVGGELWKEGRRLRLNLLSGTYTIQLIKEKLVDAQALREDILVWFDRVLRQRYRAGPAFTVEFPAGKGFERNEDILDGFLKPPDLVHLAHLCADAGFRGNNPGPCAPAADGGSP